MISGRAIDLSIVVAVYNEDPRNLERVLRRLDACVEPTGLLHEVIFVNDGSREPTTRALRQLAFDHPRVKLVELSRNFGQQAAITAGLDHSVGMAVVNIDSDMQDPPEVIPAMIAKWQEGYDVVYATRSGRRDSAAKKLTAYLFYRVLAAVSSVEIPWDTGDFRLMDRKVVDALSSCPEKGRFLRGLIPWLGFKQYGLLIDRDARELGQSTYTIKKLLGLAFDGLLSFSAAPLILLPVLGGFVFMIGLAVLVYGLVTQGELSNIGVLAGVGAFTGLQILSVGVLAVYLSKVVDETRGRPTYVVSERIGTGFMSDNDRDVAQKTSASVSGIERSYAATTK